MKRNNVCKGKSPVIIVVGIDRPEDQAQYQDALTDCSLKFPETFSGARRLLAGADIVVVSLDYELFAKEVIESGFRGHLIPVIVSAQKQFLRIPDGTPKGTPKNGVSRRDVPAEIKKLLQATQVATA